MFQQNMFDINWQSADWAACVWLSPVSFVAAFRRNVDVKTFACDPRIADTILR